MHSFYIFPEQIWVLKTVCSKCSPDQGGWQGIISGSDTLAGKELLESLKCNLHIFTLAWDKLE